MAGAGQPTSTECPAARLARQAAATILAEHSATDAKSAASVVLLERLEAIEDACSYERATSALGAFYQLLLLHGDIQEDMPWVAEGPATGRHLRRLRRLAVSAIDWIEADVDRDAAEMLRSYYLNRRFDEFTALEGFLHPGRALH